jgi:hypothetical protein
VARSAEIKPENLPPRAASGGRRVRVRAKPP